MRLESTDRPQARAAQTQIPAPVSPTGGSAASALGTFSVLIPVYNERATVLETLNRIRAVPVDKEILIVDDASTDGTRDILKNEIEGHFPDVRVFYHAENQGKGAAIRTAIPHATG